MKIQDELSNTDIVTIGVYTLGGSINPIDLEDLAIEVFNLAAKRFSWKKYKERIDLRIVLYSVNDAIKSDVGYLKGNSKFGYMLTEKGLKWIASLGNIEILTKSSRKHSTSDIVEKEKDRLQRSSAYKKYVDGEKELINIIDFREFTRVNDYFPKQIMKQKFAKIKNVTDEDEILSKVWEYLLTKFASRE